MKDQKTKTLKIEGKLSTPIDMTEDVFTDMFLKWCQQKDVVFQGCIQDTSKSK
jgi:hypothetical protein